MPKYEILKNYLTGLKKLLNVSLTIDLDGDYRNTILLSAVGRSGTTWISDVINYNNDYRYIHEPFHPNRISLLSDFEYNQYIRPGNKSKKLLIPARRILEGKVHSIWTDSDNKTRIARKRLIKDIRTNLMLKWINENFPEVPIILLLRHPFAVANSWIKLGWGIEESGNRSDIDILLSQKDLVEDYLHPFIEDIRRAYTLFEKIIYYWCIQYYVPFKQFKRDEIHLAFYENFCVNPLQEMERLFRYLNIENIDYTSIFQQINQPSRLARKDSAVNTGEDLINTWEKHLTSEQQITGDKIIEKFGLHDVYSSDIALPDIERVTEILDKF